jgi:hypothetical protein
MNPSSPSAAGEVLEVEAHYSARRVHVQALGRDPSVLGPSCRMVESSSPGKACSECGSHLQAN